MTKNSLDLSGKIDLKTIEIFENVNTISDGLGISYVVIGATARDLVLHHGFGAPIKRATTDVDFGIQISNWEGFQKLKNELFNNGFKETSSAHRLIAPNDTMVDIVPFGVLEDEDSNVQWPPKGDIEMNVLGFQEAHDNAIVVQIQKEPRIKIPVVTTQGLVLLKVIAWSERSRSVRIKDAGDLAYLLENFKFIEDVETRVFDDGLMEQYSFEMPQANAHLLGSESAAIANDATKQRIIQILNDNLQENSPNLLVKEMCEHVEHEYQDKLSLLKAFSSGFEGK